MQELIHAKLTDRRMKGLQGYGGDWAQGGHADLRGLESFQIEISDQEYTLGTEVRLPAQKTLTGIHQPRDGACRVNGTRSIEEWKGAQRKSWPRVQTLMSSLVLASSWSPFWVPCYGSCLCRALAYLIDRYLITCYLLPICIWILTPLSLLWYPEPLATPAAHCPMVT